MDSAHSDTSCCRTPLTTDAFDNELMSHTTPLRLKPLTISGFKAAVHNGNETLVMHLVREHADLNLLRTRFENGDDCVQIAVRNHSHKLLLFLLEQGASVCYRYI